MRKSSEIEPIISRSMVSANTPPILSKESTPNPVIASTSAAIIPISLIPVKPPIAPINVAKSRAKKRSGLQEMLARNREQKSKDVNKEKRTAGLADFLVGL